MLSVAQMCDDDDHDEEEEEQGGGDGDSDNDDDYYEDIPGPLQPRTDAHPCTPFVKKKT